MTEPDISDFISEPKKDQYRKQVLGKIADLLARNNIDVDDIGNVQKVNVWQGFYKNNDGEAEVVDMAGITLSPKFAEGPRWPVVQPATVKYSFPKREPKPKNSEWKTAVILPDPQIGFRLFTDLTLDPFHDEDAISAALRVINEVNPDLIVNLGDFLDFPAQSAKFLQEPAFQATTQAAVDRGHRFLADQRASAPQAEIKLLEGNHDWRISNSIIINAKWAFGLRQANKPDSWPVLSVPTLLRLDELDVEYISGYPANELWINDNLRCIHGTKVRSAGSTAAAVADDERTSTIFGHIHRIEVQHITRRTKSGPKQSLAASPGCLCRLTGAVPSVKGGIDVNGRPVEACENWQNGVAVVTYKEGDGPFSLELVPIHNGVVIFRGKEL